MSIAKSLNTIETPMGQLVCELWDVGDYPCFDIVLKRPDGTEILLAVLEHEVAENHINIRTYGNLQQEEPDYMAVIDEKVIQRYVEEF